VLEGENGTGETRGGRVVSAFLNDKRDPRGTCESPGMKAPHPQRHCSGKIGWILLWVLGIPIPVLVILFLLRGCT